MTNTQIRAGSHSIGAERCALALTAAVVVALAGPSALYAAAPCKSRLSAADQIIALNAVQNLMGRYSGLSEEHGDNSVYLENLFAMKTEGVSWKIGRGPDAS